MYRGVYMDPKTRGTKLGRVRKVAVNIDNIIIFKNKVYNVNDLRR